MRLILVASVVFLISLVFALAEVPSRAQAGGPATGLDMRASTNHDIVRDALRIQGDLRSCPILVRVSEAVLGLGGAVATASRVSALLSAAAALEVEVL
jgi:hypothetical protein